MYDTDYVVSLAHSITLMVENDRPTHTAIQAAVTQRLRTGCGYPDMSAEQYRDYLAHDGRAQVAHDIMDAVRETAYDRAMAGLPDTFGKRLLMDLLDYGNVEVWRRVADAYVPDVADYR